ncbi:Fph type histidine kinase [Rhizophagus irregularis DAOM 181602=DAOM 197198]|nr:Fph type histidine kinase [Rhizophagus irregularis DAOM 181602=DAOM 197198]
MMKIRYLFIRDGSRPLSITSRDSNNFILNAHPPDVPSSYLRSLASAECFLFLNRYDKDPQRQFEDEERDYLSNFGVNIVNEVLKRRVIIADRAKGAFISSISHELRNPLQRSKEVSDEACFVGQQMIIRAHISKNSMKFTKKGYVLISLASLSYSLLSDQYKKHAGVQDTTTTDTSSSNNIHALITITDKDVMLKVNTKFNEIKTDNKNDDLGDFSNSLDSFNNENDNLIKDLKKNNEKLFFKKSNKKELVKELICEYKEKVTDSNLDCDIIFIVDNIDQLKKIISKVDTKQAPIVFTTTLAKHGKIADFVEKLQKEIEDTQLTQRKRRKVVILTRLCGPRKLEKAIVSVLSSQQDDEKLLEEENSYFPKLIMTPPISEDDNSKLYISYNSSEKSSNN